VGRRPISIVLLAGAIGLLCAAAAPGAEAPRWRVVARAGVPSLVAVDALTPFSVWAVGSRDARPVAVRWDGRRLRTWTFAWKGAVLSGVAAVARDDVWAVGAANGRPLAVHVDGRSWKRASLPEVERGSLEAVAAVAGGDLWAVGASGAVSDLPGTAVAASARTRPLVLRFDGGRWRIVETGVAGPGTLTAIDAVSAGDVWAFGVSGPHVSGAYGFGPLVLRWHRQRWTVVPVPVGSSEYKGYAVGALDATPSGTVWTVQSENTDSCGGCVPEFARWSGARKARADFEPDFPGEAPTVYAIAAIPKGGVWAVGELGGGRPLVAYGNGSSWRIVATPFAQLRATPLYAISALSPTEVWVVGRRLIARYSP
jgi:hypothetical protein